MTTTDLVKKYGVQDVFFGAPKNRVCGLFGSANALPVTGALMLLVAFVATFFVSSHFDMGSLAMGLAVLPLMPCGMKFMDKDSGGASGATMSEADFQRKVLDGVGAQQEQVKGLETQQQRILSDIKNLSKETQKALDELTTVKNQANDAALMAQKLQKLEISLRREVRSACGDPIKRIAGDEKLRTAVNILVRQAINQNGDLSDQISTLQKALGEDSGVGATLVSPELANEIYDTLATFGKWATLRVQPVNTKITSFPVKTARAKAAFITTEGAKIPEDANKGGGAVELTMKPIAALIPVSLALIEDAQFDVTADVLDDFVEAYNERLDIAAFAGDGSAGADMGGYTGIFKGGAAVAANSGHTEAGLLKLDDFIKVLTSVDPAVLSRPAKWWLHPTVLAKFIGIKDDNGRPLFQTALEAPSFGGIGSILGYPVELVHGAPNADAANKPIAAFGDPSGAVVGIRTDFRFEGSDHHTWDTLQRSFRGYGRAGVVVRRAQAFGVLTTAGA